MKTFVVIGLGRFGTAMARELASHDNEVIVIDRNEDLINAIADEVTHAMAADIRDESVLRRMGVAECDCAIVAFASNIQENILVTLLLKEIGVKKVISKASNSMHVRVLQKVGADQIVFPEEDIGTRLARILSSGRVIDYVDLDGEYKVVEIACPKAWQGKTLKQLGLRAKYNINVLLIRRKGGGEQLINPGADQVVSANDALVIMGHEKDIAVISDGD